MSQEIKDADGVVIEVGARVVQLYIFDASKGALSCNAKCMGTVVSLGRTRVQVQFDGRLKFNNFTQTSEYVTDRVASEYLLVVKDGKMPENLSAFRGKKADHE